MGDPKITLWEELGQGLQKIIIWMAYISIGVVTKIAVDSRANSLTWRQIFVKSVLSIFAGVMAAVFCENTGYVKWAKLIVPVSTLLGEAIVLYLMHNWKQIANKVLPAYFQNSKTNK